MCVSVSHFHFQCFHDLPLCCLLSAHCVCQLIVGLGVMNMHMHTPHGTPHHVLRAILIPFFFDCMNLIYTVCSYRFVKLSILQYFYIYLSLFKAVTQALQSKSILHTRIFYIIFLHILFTSNSVA